MSRQTDSWVDFVTDNSFHVESIPQRLFVLEQLVWRLEIFLSPLPSRVESSISETLDKLDVRQRKINGQHAPSENWVKIRSQYITLSISLVAAARLRWDAAKFEERFEALSSFADDPVVRDHLSYERCLWALAKCDYKALEFHLSEWNPDDTEPIWLNRKTALLIQIGNEKEAARLPNESLSIIRDSSTYSASDKIGAASRESWTLLFAGAFQHSLGDASSVQAMESDWATTARLKRLTTLECDPYEQRNALIRALDSSIEDEHNPTFELGNR